MQLARQNVNRFLIVDLLVVGTEDSIPVVKEEPKRKNCHEKWIKSVKISIHLPEILWLPGIQSKVLHTQDEDVPSRHLKHLAILELVLCEGVDLALFKGVAVVVHACYHAGSPLGSVDSQVKMAEGQINSCRIRSL